MVNKYGVGMAFDKEDVQHVSSKLINLKNFKLNEKKIHYLKKIFLKSRAIKKIIFYLNKYKDFSTNQFFLIENVNSVNFKKNFILSGLNLAFLGFLIKKDLPINKCMILWPDVFFNKKIIKIPGREIIKNLVLDKSIIKKIIVIGNVDNVIQLFLENKFKIKTETIQLPYGEIYNFTKYLPKFKHDELIILTLPTPKQEQLADYISRFNKYYKIICLGGALNMVVGKEKPIPDYLNKIFFAETLWRLQYETKRRLARLLISLFYYSYGIINKDFKKYKFNIKDERF
jgi:recombinational DNA repair protein RecR